MIYFIFVSKQAVGKCPPVNKHEPSPFNQPKAADPPTCCLSTHYNEKQGRLVCLTKFCAAVGRLFSDCIAPSNICLFVNIVDSKLHFLVLLIYYHDIFTYLLPRTLQFFNCPLRVFVKTECLWGEFQWKQQGNGRKICFLGGLTASAEVYYPINQTSALIVWYRSTTFAKQFPKKSNMKKEKKRFVYCVLTFKKQTYRHLQLAMIH